MAESEELTGTGGSENIGQSGGTEPTGPVSPSAPPYVEIALACLATAAHILGVPADYEGLCRAFPSRKTDELSFILLRAAKKLDIKAKLIITACAPYTRYISVRRRYGE